MMELAAWNSDHIICASVPYPSRLSNCCCYLQPTFDGSAALGQLFDYQSPILRLFPSS